MNELVNKLYVYFETNPWIFLMIFNTSNDPYSIDCDGR